MDIDFGRFLESLQYMGVGMVCIFLVIGVIAFLTYLLNKATAPRTPTPGDDEDTDE